MYVMTTAGVRTMATPSPAWFESWLPWPLQEYVSTSARRCRPQYTRAIDGDHRRATVQVPTPCTEVSYRDPRSCTRPDTSTVPFAHGRSAGRDSADTRGGSSHTEARRYNRYNNAESGCANVTSSVHICDGDDGLHVATLAGSSPCDASTHMPEPRFWRHTPSDAMATGRAERAAERQDKLIQGNTGHTDSHKQTHHTPS